MPAPACNAGKIRDYGKAVCQEAEYVYINTKGLVLRETPYKESSRILTVLTSDLGKITVGARGAKRKGSKTASSTQFLAFSDMTLSENRGRYTLTEAKSIELFQGLSDDIAALSMGAYFAELLETVSDEDMPSPEILSLGLNGLFALSEGKRDRRLVKAAFEMRLLCLAGFAPLVEGCGVCGREDIVRPVLDVDSGMAACTSCESGGRRYPLCPGSLDALRHITACDRKRLFSFTLNEDSLNRLERACENYALAQLDRGFSTLDYYKKIKDI